MKRSRSGSRPPGQQAKKNNAPYHARYIYELAFARPDGSLIGPHDEGFEEKLSRLRTQCPDLAQKLAEGTLDVGLEPGSWEERCFNLLDILMKQKRAMWFLKPVDPVAMRLPDYALVVKHPMDLGTVKTRLTGRYYSEPQAFADEVRLTFNNAMLYNMAASVVHQDAFKLKQQFDKKFEAIDAGAGAQSSSFDGAVPLSAQSSFELGASAPEGDATAEPWRRTAEVKAAAESAPAPRDVLAALREPGIGVIAEVKRVVNRISAHPELHGLVLQDIRRAAVRRFSYSVFYRVLPTRIEVFAVFHDSRDPTEWQSRIGPQ
jgi:plasmid stabilization system protein ParE